MAGMEAKNQAETNVISPQIEALVFLLNLKMGCVRDTKLQVVHLGRK
jgi:hypothetical protein